MYYKNPFNYVGGKYKLLPQILSLFPSHIDTFVDLFGGGRDNLQCRSETLHIQRKIYSIS